MIEKIGELFVVSTPIGNLEDITLRALKTLHEADIIAAEDTRHAKKLLNHFQIHTPLTSYHDFNKEEKSEILINKLKEGNHIAVLCDAGTPTICDPGYYLIRRAIQCDIRIIPIPGPTALIAALTGSGAPPDRFTFEGFAPRKRGPRQRWFESLQQETKTILFYESPHRILSCLTDLISVLGDRDIILARELTKTFEEFIRGKATEIKTQLEEKAIRGEITVIIEGIKRSKKNKNKNH
ncbi:MAG TPA: 16S rRNA (cytidine(1402)-2'-O)-methyltransferase [Nitrospiria bacterium]|jgi:16S rRNA (cytidine1402-2'-O)-methyltransferase